MSDTPNGPGWWLASDGKWYPPQPSTPPQPMPTPSTPQSANPGSSTSPVPPSPYGASTPVPPVPNYGPPPGYQTPSYQVPGSPGQQSTNGLAVAALVLGILWICGLGSLLALIFGLVALSQIKSRGQKGKGLAVGGIVLGALGLLATIGGAIALVVASDELIEVSDDELDDVEIASCQRDGASGLAVLEVTNDSSKPSTYIISIEFNGSGANNTTVPTLDPDESTIVEVRSTADITGDARCRVEYVQRLAG